MWPFKRKEAPAALVERVEALERSIKGLRLEWEDVYDRLNRAAARMTKRAALAARALQAQEETPEDAPGSPLGPAVQMDAFSQDVLRLRRHRGA